MAATFWGRCRDITQIGRGKSSLDAIVARVAAKLDRRVESDQFPDRGIFYRSDQFNFAKIGVPALYLKTGTDFLGRAAGWGKEQSLAFETQRYHQPSDQIGSDWNFDGMIDDARPHPALTSVTAPPALSPLHKTAAWRGSCIEPRIFGDLRPSVFYSRPYSHELDAAPGARPMNPSELAQPARRSRARRATDRRERFTAAPVTVTVTYTPEDHRGAAPLASGGFELVAEPSEHSHWTCAGDFESTWLESLSTMRCSEVVLTARLGANVTAQHLVLELAELLRFKLNRSQPLIRVLFLPAASVMHAARHHA